MIRKKISDSSHANPISPQRTSMNPPPPGPVNATQTKTIADHHVSELNAHPASICPQFLTIMKVSTGHTIGATVRAGSVDLMNTMVTVGTTGTTDVLATTTILARLKIISTLALDTTIVGTMVHLNMGMGVMGTSVVTTGRTQHLVIDT
ncbi:hypothetical protein Zmor_022243 [Zophobas morio]|uniref:Uncharacterized protein n=1 Tax=Zophobas morio TaxID=2755281 RepID=A0AA38HV11_9CUCU|nr:hypothetical protein Zmor_022243 [Zophobas morio]